MDQVGTRLPAGRNNMKKLAAFVLAIFVCAIAVVAAQQKKAATPEQEWRTYNHDLAGTRFSPLTDVNAGNVANLKQAWVYPSRRRRAADVAAVSVARRRRCRLSSAASCTFPPATTSSHSRRTPEK